MEKCKVRNSAVFVVSSCLQKPHPEEMQKLVAPLAAILADANGRTEGKRKDSFHHQKTISEFLQALVFVANTAEAGKGHTHGSDTNVSCSQGSLHSILIKAGRVRNSMRIKSARNSVQRIRNMSNGLTLCKCVCSETSKSVIHLLLECLQKSEKLRGKISSQGACLEE